VKALSPLPWQGPSPLPLRQAGPCPAGGQSPRPAPAPPLAGASRPPGRALASAGPGPAGLQGTVARGRGKRGSRFLIPPALTTAPSSLLWQRPSPLPQSNADPCPAGGPKPPASARPALGGRFAPAGSGAGLCCAVGTGTVWKRSARAGKRGSRFLFPSKGEIPFPGPGKSSRPAGGGEAFFSSLLKLSDHALVPCRACSKDSICPWADPACHKGGSSCRRSCETGPGLPACCPGRTRSAGIAVVHRRHIAARR